MLVIIIAVFILMSLLLMAASDHVPAVKAKKKATPRPSISVSPYSMPLPMMNSSLKVLYRPSHR
jgi:hypothetical protein